MPLLSEEPGGEMLESLGQEHHGGEALGYKEVSSTQAYLDSIMSDDTIDALFMAA